MTHQLRAAPTNKFAIMWREQKEFIFDKFLSTAFSASYLKKYEIGSRGSNLQRHSSFAVILKEDDEDVIGVSGSGGGEPLALALPVLDIEGEREDEVVQEQDDDDVGELDSRLSLVSLMRSMGSTGSLNLSSTSTQVTRSGPISADNSNSPFAQIPRLFDITETEYNSVTLGGENPAPEAEGLCGVGGDGEVAGTSKDFGSGSEGKEGVMEMTFCQRVTHQEYVDQSLFNSNAELKGLMRAVLDDMTVAPAYKENFLRGFYKTHPFIFRDVLGDEDCDKKLRQWQGEDRKLISKITKAFGQLKKVFRK